MGVCRAKARVDSEVFRRWPVSLLRIGAVIAVGIFAVGFAWAGDDQPSHDVLARGADLFAREWLPED